MATPNQGFSVVSRQIKPIYQEDTYPVVADTDLFGGLRVIPNASALSTIPLPRMTVGMLAVTQDTGLIYQLQSISPSIVWTLFISLSGLANPAVGFGADLVAYQVTASGILVPNSVARTVRQKLNERISVDDFSGVDNTGGSDSSAGIQNALNAYVNVGTKGSTLDFSPGGNYICGSLTIPTTDGNNNTLGERGVKLRLNKATLKGRNTDSYIINVGKQSPLTFANGVVIENGVPESERDAASIKYGYGQRGGESSHS